MTLKILLRIVNNALIEEKKMNRTGSLFLFVPQGSCFVNKLSISWSPIYPHYQTHFFAASYLFLLERVSTFQEKLSAHALQRNQEELKAVKLTFGSRDWRSWVTTSEPYWGLLAAPVNTARTHIHLGAALLY